MSPRAIVVGPAISCFLGCLVLAVMSLLAWGAAEPVEYPDWAPTAGGLLYALPAGVVALGSSLRLWKATFGHFRLVRLKAALAAAAYFAITAVAIAYAATIDRAASYEAEFNIVSGRYDPTFNVNTFLMVSALLGGFFSGLTALAFKHLSMNAISHATDEVEGPDPMGSLMEDLA